MSTQEKALAINLDAAKFGTFAEIGAGQEVARWFFHVGHASATVAKSMSAYDMVISDIIYGPTDHYVSRARLESMLDHEWAQLLERLNPVRAERSSFFVFADTVATRSRSRNQHGQGWMGMRFQAHPKAPCSQIIIHVNLLDQVPVSEQEALGILGVNLVYGAFHRQQPEELMKTLMEGLSRLRVDIDMIKFSGSVYEKVDNRLASLQLVELGLTDATMFTAQGEVVQPAEVLYKKPVLILRGRFRPITSVMLDMLNGAEDRFKKIPGVSGDPVVLMGMTLQDLGTGPGIDHRDFLDRADMLGALGKTVMVSNYTRFDSATSLVATLHATMAGICHGRAHPARGVRRTVLHQPAGRHPGRIRAAVSRKRALVCLPNAGRVRRSGDFHHAGSRSPNCNICWPTCGRRGGLRPLKISIRANSTCCPRTSWPPSKMALPAGSSTCPRKRRK